MSDTEDYCQKHPEMNAAKKVFTDDNLQRMKEFAIYGDYPEMLNAENLSALITRLDAAERVADMMEVSMQNTECGYCLSKENDDNETVHSSDCEVMSNLKAWRKACGK